MNFKHIRISPRRAVGALFLFLLHSGAAALSMEETLDVLARGSNLVAADSLTMVAEMAEASTIANFSDPEIEGERLWAAGEGENKWNASISWSFDWPGAYKARRQEGKAKQFVALARYEVSRRQRMRIMAEGLNAYVAARKKTSLLEKQLEVTDRMGELVAIMSEHGRATALDESKIAIERGRLMAALQIQRDAVGEGLQALAAEAGVDVEKYIVAMDPEFDLGAPGNEEDWKELWMRSPDFMLATMEVGEAEAALKSVKAEAFPEITLGYTHAYEEGTHFNGGRIGLSIPLFSQRGRRKGAELQMEAADNRAMTMMVAKEAEAGRMLNRLAGLKRSLDELGPVFDVTSPEALLRKSFEAGQITLLTYLTERNYYLEAEMDYIDLQSAYSALRTQLRLL